MIRPAREGELELLSELAMRSKAHWGYSEAFMRACASELTVRRDHVPRLFVCERAGAIIGFCAWSPINAVRAELEFLFVEPSAIGSGYGRALLDHACADIAQRGHRILEIQGDPHAARFYRAAGARQIGERESASIPGRKLPLYELEVLSP
jgi:GNAT superfamily N-acetyltransferase